MKHPKLPSQYLLPIYVSLALLLSTQALSQGRTFGLLAKDVTDSNFVDAWKGCQEEAVSTGDKCILLGGKTSQAHVQALEFKQALDRNLSALAISVTDSDVIARAVQETSPQIPLITFDSSFSGSAKSLSQSEVGISNLKFGKTLASLALNGYPQGGHVCILTAEDTNIEQRVQGIREALSGNDQWPEGQRLSGENGWYENRQCPLTSLDGRYQVGFQLSPTKPGISLPFDSALRYVKPDVFISSGSWPLMDPEAYRQSMHAYQQQNGDIPLMVVAVGAILPDYEQLMKEHLLNGLVSIDFPTIGKSAMKEMRDLADGKQPEAVVSVPTITRFQK